VFVVTTIVVVLAAYVGSYFHLSRRGMQEARAVHMDGFYYVPLDELNATRDLSRHKFYTSLYAPLNWVDQKAFGSLPAGGCILWELS
jgi:hypothetical protein